MSTAEPFMPAHEPPPPTPREEIDIDHHADVIFDRGVEGEEDGPVLDADAPAPPYRRPHPGETLPPERLHDDLGD